MKDQAKQDEADYAATARAIEAEEERAYKAGKDLPVKTRRTFRAKGIYVQAPAGAEQEARALRNQRRPMSQEQAEDEIQQRRDGDVMLRTFGGPEEDLPLKRRVEERRRLNALKASGGPR